MEKLGEEHNTRLRLFQEKLETVFPDGLNRLLLGSGGCKNCARCTYPDAPCAFPEKMIVSMEAAGIVVSDICKSSNIPYYYGPNTLTYTGCVLLI
jgi:predicted metal-binding protein